MASEAASNATWKALSTLEWKKKQKKPAAASQNVGAILGEAADVVVGKYANSSGPNSSPYLNRLSEIQIQDEAYIHQQLVKEEVKPKRPPPHRVFVGKGSRSSRGLKLSNSRKVRFNEGGEASPKHKSPTAAAAAGSAVGFAVVARALGATEPTAASPERRARFARTSRDSSTSPTAAAAGAGTGAGGAVKAGKRAGVSFEPPGSSTVSSSNGVDAPQQSLGNASQAAALGSAGDAAALKQAAPAPAGRSPSPMQQRPQALQVPAQQQHVSTSSSASHAVRAQQNSGAGSHTSSNSGQQAAAESAIMVRFLQQQPCELDSPGRTGRSDSAAGGSSGSSGGSVGGSSGARSASLELGGLQPAGRQGSGPAVDARMARRSTDLVDKQLQWLRNSTGSPSSSSNSSSSCSSAVAPQGTSAAGLPGSSNSASGGATVTMGYRPIAIPQELFDRWSTIGGPKPPSATAAPASPPTATATANAASSSGDSATAAPASSNSSKAVAGKRNSSSYEGGLPSSSGRQGAGSPLGSRPSSGHEALGGSHLVARAATGSSSLAGATTAAAAAAAAAAGAQWGQHDGTHATPSRRLSATNVMEGRSSGEHPRHGVLSAGRRTSSADSSTLLALVSSIKPPAGSSKPTRAPASAVPSSLATARSLPSSGRASPSREPTSPRAYGLTSTSNSGAGGGCSSGTASQLRRSSCDKLQAAAHSAGSTSGGYGDSSGAAANARGARAAAALGAAALSAGAATASKGSSERRNSRATGSTSSSHGDDGERWELPAGRRSPSTSAAAAVGSHHGGSSTQAGLASAAAAGSLGSRYGSSGGSSGSKAHLPDIGAKGPSGQLRR